MKSKTSCFNRTIFKKNITHFWPIWTVILVWNLFVMPFMIYNSSVNYRMMSEMTEKEMAQYKINDLVSLLSIYANPAILFIFSVVAAMAVFSYLYHSRSANAIHALPVSRKELFLTNYLSGLLFLIVPEAVGFLTGMLVGAMCGHTGMNVMLHGFVMACGVSFVFYNLTVFIAMFAGQLAAVAVFAVILNFLYVGIKSMIALLMSVISYGMPMSVSTGRLGALSPLYYLSGCVRVIYSENEVASLGGGNAVAAYALVSVFFVAAAYLVYRIRNMETAGSLISIPWINPIFRWGAAFCGGVLFSLLLSSVLGIRSGAVLFSSVLISAVLFGAVFFFAAQMFLEKGFRVFHKKRVIECGAFLAVFVGMLVCIECDLFGQEKKMPKLSEITTAYLNEYSVIEGKDEEIIGRILDLHQQIIASKKEFESMYGSGESSDYVSIRYYLKNGSVLTRNYQIPSGEEILEDETSALYKIADLAATPKVFERGLFGTEYENIVSKECSMALYEGDGEEKDGRQHRFSKEDAEKIYEAVVADIREGRFRQRVFSRYRPEGDDSYQNEINLEFTCKEPFVSGYMAYNGAAFRHEADQAGYATVYFDQNCVNIVEALIETGAIDNVKDLTPAQ